MVTKFLLSPFILNIIIYYMKQILDFLFNCVLKYYKLSILLIIGLLLILIYGMLFGIGFLVDYLTNGIIVNITILNNQFILFPLFGILFIFALHFIIKFICVLYSSIKCFFNS